MNYTTSYAAYDRFNTTSLESISQNPITRKKEAVSLETASFSSESIVVEARGIEPLSEDLAT
jgi:hypothetical protein